MTLYIDLILIENIIMNYIIIFSTAIICKVEIKQFRIIIASTIGAVYSIMLYISKLRIYNNFFIKVFLTITMVYISYNPKRVIGMLKQLVIFYLTSFCFGGAAYYLFYCVNPNLIKSINGIFVGTYPIKIAILGGILGFFLINISFKLIKSKVAKKNMIYSVEIFYQKVKTEVKVLLDTGNLLTEPITNIPVVIIEANKLKDIIPENILNNMDNILDKNIFDNMAEDIKRRYSIIPFSSIGNNNGIIIGFRPDYIKIQINDDEEIIKKVVIGIYKNKISKNGLYSGLIGLNLLNDYVRSENNNEYNSNIKI